MKTSSGAMVLKVQQQSNDASDSEENPNWGGAGNKEAQRIRVKHALAKQCGILSTFATTTSSFFSLALSFLTPLIIISFPRTRAWFS
jgi:hypothetical protein